jgi:hypothetical protein
MNWIFLPPLSLSLFSLFFPIILFLFCLIPFNFLPLFPFMWDLDVFLLNLSLDRIKDIDGIIYRGLGG